MEIVAKEGGLSVFDADVLNTLFIYLFIFYLFIYVFIYFLFIYLFFCQVLKLSPGSPVKLAKIYPSRKG